ncbi:MAG: orotidine-5'-phosphate decarboxylase [Candidatus Sumerlaeia bacterium]
MTNRLLSKLLGPPPHLFLGLDPQRGRMPAELASEPDALERFCRTAVEACGELIAGVKINFAFFEVEGSAGLRCMERLLEALPPRLATIGDAKRGDIGSSAALYARALFETWNFDAATVNPLMGGDAVAPFLHYADRTVFLLAMTSNRGAQDIIVPLGFFDRMLERTAVWNAHNNIGLVVGATKPQAVAAALERFPAMPILAPGLGAQGAPLEALRNIVAHHPEAPLLLPLSRALLYPDGEGGAFPDNIRAAARHWHRTLAELKESNTPGESR